MNDLYFQNGQKWHSVMYKYPNVERWLYFIICFLMTINIIFGINVWFDIAAAKAKIATLIIKTSSHTENTNLVLHHLDQNNQPIINIVEFLLKKYITTREELTYDDEQGMRELQKKYSVIKQLSSKEVFDNYYKNSSANSINSDVSMIINDIQKVIIIEKIEFQYEQQTQLSKLYSQFTSIGIPRYAKIYFTTIATNENKINKRYVANIGYSFFLNEKMNKNIKDQFIEFKVNEYYVTEN